MCINRQRWLRWLVMVGLIAMLSVTGQPRRVLAQPAPDDTEITTPDAVMEDWVADAAGEVVYDSAEPEEVEAAAADTNRLYLPMVAVGVDLQSLVNAAGTAFVVTKVADTNDHACNADCSLREAAAAAAATTAVDTIVLPKGTYKLSLGPIALGSTHLVGAGASKSIIDGQQRSGVITILGGEVAIQNVTVRNGKGPGIYQDVGRLTVADSVITANSAADSCGGGISSVVDNDKDLTILNSRITSNRAQDGGGICLSTVEAKITNSTIDGNQAVARGGGIYANEGSVAMSNSTLSNNRAGTKGGGFYCRLGGGTIESSAIIKNQALDGGGLWSNESGIDLINTTVSGNLARHNGGGVDNETGTVLTLNYATVAFNVAAGDKKLGGDGGGIFNANDPYAKVILRHTLLGKNNDQDGPADDCAGTLTSDTYNLLQHTTTCALTGNLLGNITGVDPKLGPLDWHDGTTMNHLPVVDSKVIDAIPVDACALTVDQRVVTRPQDGNGDGRNGCDIGATERKATQLTLEAVADSYVRADLDIRMNDNYGRERTMIVGANRDSSFGPYGAADAMRSLVRFDTSAIKGTIKKATLQLTLFWINSQPDVPFKVELHRITQPWVEGNGAETYVELVPDATGTDPAYGVAWAALDDNNQAQPACDTTVLATAKISPKVAKVGDVVSWDVTAIVQDWLRNPANNYGLMLRDFSTDGTFRFLGFGTREGDLYPFPDRVRGPRLVIEQ